MSRPKDGGSAFPRIDGIEQGDPGMQYVQSAPGMSLRDWFAGQAIVALFAQSARPDGPGIGQADYPGAAEQAYRIADAMLAEKEAPRG